MWEGFSDLAQQSGMYTVHVVHEAEFMNEQISLRLLGIILRVLRLEISVYNVYIKNQFQTTFAGGGGGGKFHQ